MSKPDTETPAEAQKADTAESGLVARLRQHKAGKSGFDSTILPETGITARWPQFKSHGIWMKATRLAKGDTQGAMNFYLPLICTFDGEKLSLAEFKELMPTGDILYLLGKVLGDMVPGDEDDGGDDLGNALH